MQKQVITTTESVLGESEKTMPLIHGSREKNYYPTNNTDSLEKTYQTSTSIIQNVPKMAAVNLIKHFVDDVF